MFDQAYEFRYTSKETGVPNVFDRHILTFACRFGQQYIVEVEQYDDQFYAIKFFLKSHRLSANRYSLTTQFFDAGRVIATCLQIMKYFYERNPQASFGFVASPLLHENKALTKRFRVYRRIMENVFPPYIFHHYTYEQQSVYLLLNRKIETGGTLLKILEMCQRYYQIYF